MTTKKRRNDDELKSEEMTTKKRRNDDEKAKK